MVLHDLLDSNNNNNKNKKNSACQQNNRFRRQIKKEVSDLFVSGTKNPVKAL